MTRAIRVAMAASAIALAGTGAAHAGDCASLAAMQRTHCIAPASETANTPVFDLTSVVGRHVDAALGAHAPSEHAPGQHAPNHVVPMQAQGITTQLAPALSVSIVNTGTIDKSGSGDVVGIDADFAGADLSVVNRGSIYVESDDGLADGIFAYGGTVSVNNNQQGTIEAYGYTWAAGIEAQGDSVTVNNVGSITASASAYDTYNGIYGYAYGIYAAGGDGGVVVNNRGSIDVSGTFATGIYAYDGGIGGVSINNRGDITATADTGYATGIKAVTNVAGSDIDVVNRGSIEAMGLNGASGIVAVATGIGSSASVNNVGDIYAASTAYYSVAEGIVASADGDASLRNSGTITIGYGDYAYGGLALAFAGDASVNNSGSVSVYGGLGAYGFVLASQNGYANATNSGTITVDSSIGTAAGIDAGSLAGTTVTNKGDIDVTASKYAFGVLANSSQGDTVVDNRGSIATDGKYSFGVLAQSSDGDATIYNSGMIAATGKYSYGAVAASTYGDAAIFNSADGVLSGYSGDVLAVGAFTSAGNDGNASIDNAGSISATGAGYAQIAYGAVVQTGAGDGLVTNSGDISASNSYGAASGVIVRSSAGGDATVVNYGSISAVATGSGVYYGYYGTYTVNTDVVGISASAPDATATVNNSGTIDAYSYAGVADGIFASGGSVDVTNSGSIDVYGYAQAVGVFASATGGDVSVANTGGIDAYSLGGVAVGVYGYAGDGGVSIYNGGTISATAGYYSAYGLLAVGQDVSVYNSGDIIAVGGDYGQAVGINAVGIDTVAVDNVGSVTAADLLGNATGIMGYSGAGDVVLDNSGTIEVYSYAGNAIGMYGYSYAGDVSIGNSGTIDAYSFAGLADGIFASGANVDVSNSGDISAISYAGDWAAGIEAQGDDLTTVYNSGTIYASAAYGEAFGIYATGGASGVMVDNTGSINAQGYVANGIYAQSGGPISITNSGDITAGSLYVGQYYVYGSLAATGIHAATNYPGSDVSVENNGGDISAVSYYGGAGIEVLALGTGSSGSADNLGTIYASAYAKYGYGAAGIVVSSDGDADIYNGGSITAVSGGQAYGALALAFAGNATVTNAGDISVSSTAAAYYGAYGIVSAAQNGNAYADNSGNIDIVAGKYGQGIQASSLSGTTVTNSGAISVDAKYAYGVFATSGYGDVAVSNTASGFIDSYSYAGYGTGIFAQSTLGDVSVYNAGGIDVYGFSQAVGVFARASDGDVSVDNTGSIDAYSYGGVAAGIFGNAGDVSVDNTGTISASARYYSAYGVLARGQDVGVTNAGDIIAQGGVYGRAIGIYASGTDTVAIDNAGTITAAASGPYGYAFGVYARTTYGDAVVGNSGSIDAFSQDLLANGIYVGSLYGNVEVDNAATGNISAYSPYGGAVSMAGASYFGGVSVNNSGTLQAVAGGDVVSYATGMIGNSLAGDVALDNAGSITAISIYGDAIGMFGYSFYGDVSASNSGLIDTYSVYGLADGIFASGRVVDVSNSGGLYADGYTWGAGIEAQGDVATSVVNTGDISAIAVAYYQAAPDSGGTSLYGYAYGIYATGGDGGVYVGNRGTITAAGPFATGIYAYDGGIGGIGINNRGDIAATAVNGYATGINAVTTVAGSDVGIDNRGTIDATGYNGATGIVALAGGEGAGIDVINRGSISAIATEGKYGNAVGLAASGDGDVSLRNTGAGSIYASGAYAYGVLSLAFAGDSDVVNAGDIVSLGNGSGLYSFSYGVISSSQNGTASATNTGSISATSTGLISVVRGIDASGMDVDVVNRGMIETYGKYSTGINAVASTGDVTVRNQGSIYAGGKYTYGIAGISTDGDVNITNAAGGLVDAYSSGGLAVGVLGISTYDDVNIVNAGSVVSHGDYAGLSAGVYASSDNNDVSVINRGSIDASTYYSAYGVLANIGDNDELSVDNRGSINATSVYANATGIDGSSLYGGDVVLRNRGTIAAATSDGDATGISGTVLDGDLTLANTASGSITANSVDGDATGMLGVLTGAGVTVNNAGSISVASVNGNAYAIRLVAGTPLAPFGIATVNNSGSLLAGLDGTGIAIQGTDGVENITNRGWIGGAIVTNGGDDAFSNLRNATWQLVGNGTDFGAGNDSFTNARGATLLLADAGMTFGAGNDHFSNMGTVVVSGTSTIDLTDGAAAAPTFASPNGADMFTNNGTLSFLDGSTNDSLTITGSFGGNGEINLDVNLGSSLSDHLYLQGGLGADTHQSVNVMLLDGLPSLSDVGNQLQLVHVSGDSSPSAFVAGNVLGISPRDFLTMGLTLSSQPDNTALAGTGGSSYLLSVETYVSGLNDAGVLASSAALGVDNLMTSSIGNWRDRTYSARAIGGKPVFAGFTPWVRGFRDESGMSPDHLAGNFAQLSSAHLSQDNFGTEMGLEYQALNGFRFGTLFSKSEGRQYLVDARGRDTIRGNTLGLYGTWMSPAGFYVDASWRRMQFEANIDSIGGRQRTDGNAVTTNLETGYAWELGNGVNIQPQVRYTATSINGLRIEGDKATFQSQDAQWKRGSAGVSLWKDYGGGSGWLWTPYAELSVVRTFQGVSSYSINDDYFGNVGTEGTSALVKFGLGAQKGHLAWRGGLNWIDGGSFDGAMGGQMSLQYSW